MELHYSCHNFGGFFRRYGNWWSLFEVAAIFVSVALVPFSWLVQLKVRLANHPRYVALYSLLRAKYRFGICMECRCHKISVNHCKKRMAFMLKYISSSRAIALQQSCWNRIRTVMKWKRPSRLKIWSLAWQLKETWQDIWWMSREGEVCWFQNCHFDLQGLLGEEVYAEWVVMWWCSEKRNKILGNLQFSRRMKKMSSSFSVKMSNRKWVRFLHRSICMRMKLNFL